MPPTEPGQIDIVLRVLGALVAVAAGVLGAVYVRRLGVDAAQKRLNDINRSSIEALQHEMASRIRMLELREAQQEQLEDDLEECHRDRQVMKRSIERWESVLGRIWIDQFSEGSDEQGSDS